MNFKRVLKSVACTAICAAAAVTMSGCKNYGKMINEQPEEYIKMASENTAKAAFKSKSSDDYSSVFDEAMKDGTFKLDFEAEGITFSGECYANEKQSAYSQSLTMTGAEGTSAQVYVYADKSSMKFGTIGQSGSHIYDVNFSTIADKIASSIFAPDSGSSYAIDRESYDMILENFEEIFSEAEGNENISNEYEEILNNYLDSHKPLTEKNVDADIDGETIKSNIFTYEIPYEDIKMLAEQLSDIAVKESGESGEEVKNQMQELFDRIDDCKITLVYYINSKSNLLMKSDLTVGITADSEYSEAYANAFYGADPENSEKQRFVLGLRDDDKDEYFTADIRNNESLYEMSISMYDGEEETKLLTLTRQCDGDMYTIAADLLDSEYSAELEGMVTVDKNSFNLTLDKISVSEGAKEFSYSPQAVVNVRKGGEILKLDAEKEYLDITEDEMDELIQNIQSDFMAVFEETVKTEQE